MSTRLVRRWTIVTLASLVGPTIAMGQERAAPPPILKGGIVHQLRSLSEDALSALQGDRGEDENARQSADDTGDVQLRDPVSLPRLGRRVPLPPPISSHTRRSVPNYQPRTSDSGFGSEQSEPTFPGTGPSLSQGFHTQEPAEVISPRTERRLAARDTLSAARPHYGEVHVETELPEHVRQSIGGSMSDASDVSPSAEGQQATPEATPGPSSAPARVELPGDARSQFTSGPPSVPRIPLPDGKIPNDALPAPDKALSDKALLDNASDQKARANPGRAIGAPSRTADQQLATSSPSEAASTKPPSEQASAGLPSSTHDVIQYPGSSEPSLPSLPPRADNDFQDHESQGNVTQKSDEQRLDPQQSSAQKINALDGGTPGHSPPTLPSPKLPRADTVSIADPRTIRSDSSPAAVQTVGNSGKPETSFSPKGADDAGSSIANDKRLAMQTPRVEVLLVGPKDLPVGSPVNYEVHLNNGDDIPLAGVILRMEIPAGIQVKPLAPSHGEFELQPADHSTIVAWQVDHLAARQTARAPVQLLAETAKNFAISVDWTLIPLSGKSEFGVQSPRLELALEGPAEVHYGQPNVYRLRLRNAGTAAARGVVVKISADPYGASSSEVGEIAPGREEVVDVELTFNQRGPIQIAARAQASGGLESTTDIDVIVRQAKLAATLDGPTAVYHGEPTSYSLRLSNIGDAPGEDLVASITLPKHSEVVQAPAGAETIEDRLTWSVEELLPGDSAEFSLQLQLASEGENPLAFNCTGPAGLKVAANATTQVHAIADLKLVVSDPISPAPVSGEVVYELSLTNRGSKSAIDVSVVAQFSEGIEPTRAEGQQCRIVPGQVLFEPISKIAAGQSIRLHVYAKAARGGMHRFRAEVRSDASGGIRLVQEESTQFLGAAGRIATPGGTAVLR